MELLYIIVCIIVTYFRTGTDTVDRKLERLPVGRNDEGIFDETAFTSIAKTLRGDK